MQEGAETIQQQKPYRYSVEFGESKSGSTHVMIIKSLKVYSDDPIELVRESSGLIRKLMSVAQTVN